MQCVTRIRCSTNSGSVFFCKCSLSLSVCKTGIISIMGGCVLMMKRLLGPHDDLKAFLRL